MRFALALLAAMLGACDPGGGYQVPGAGIVVDQIGGRDIVPGNSQTSLRANASWFTSSVYTSLGLTNNGSTALVIRPNKIRMSDREGPLVLRNAFGCAEHDTELVVLAPRETCEMSPVFDVEVDRDRLRTLTLTNEGVTRGEAAVPITITFELLSND